MTDQRAFSSEKSVLPIKEGLHVRITKVEIDGFGVWSNLILPDLPDPLTVVYGPNEAGKTTLMQFIRTVLYGFSTERRRRYLPPVHGGNGGGQLNAAGSSGEFSIVRRSDGKATQGDVRILAADGSAQDSDLLNSLYSQIDESTYNNVFAVGLHELQELASINDTEAGQYLYDLTGGLDRVSLIEVLRELKAAQNRLTGDEHRAGQLLDLMDERNRLDNEVRQLANQVNQWVRLWAERTALEQQLTEQQDELNHLQLEIRVAELAVNLRDRWTRRRKLDQELSAMGNVPSLPEGIVERLNSLNERIDQRRKQRAQMKLTYYKLRDEFRSFPINRVLWGQQSRVQALAEQQDWLSALTAQIQRLESEVTDSDRVLVSHQQLSGLGNATMPFASGDLSPITLKSLRGPARDLLDATRSLDQAKREYQSERDEKNRTQQQLTKQLNHHKTTNLTEALGEARQQASQIRRRIQIEERLDQLTRSLRDLEEEMESPANARLLPIRTLALLGVSTSFFGMWLLAGLFRGWLNVSDLIGSAMLWIGGLGLIGTIAYKFWLEHSLRFYHDENQEHLDCLDREAENLRVEQRDLDCLLPSEGGPWVSRLKTAEKEVAELERLVPLESTLETASQRSESAQTHTSRVANDFQETRTRWATALLAIGLPETTTPDQLDQLSAQYESMLTLKREADIKRDELQQRRRELETLQTRLQKLANETGLPYNDDDPMNLLRQITSALESESHSMRRRTEIREKAKQLCKEHQQCLHQSDDLNLKRETLLSEAGVSNEQALMQLVERRDQIRQLKKEREKIAGEIESLISGQCCEDDIRREFEKAEKGSADMNQPGQTIEQRLKILQNQRQKCEDQLKQSFERRGQLAEQIKTSAADRKLAKARFQLAAVEEQLAVASRRWRVLTTSYSILQEVCRIYEAQHQPATLRAASQYLERLTSGRYRRVWTRLGEEVLYVDDADGKVLAAESLSRGTREQIFLSLRLALVDSYALRGVVLPLILDDVLVNFDTHRARAAAEVLQEFADAGHQVLVFTCHEHVMRIFQSLSVDVRQLPDHNDPADVALGWQVMDPLPTQIPTVHVAKSSKDVVEKVAVDAKPDAIPMASAEQPALHVDAYDEPNLYAEHTSDEHEYEWKIDEAETRRDQQPAKPFLRAS